MLVGLSLEAQLFLTSDRKAAVVKNFQSLYIRGCYTHGQQLFMRCAKEGDVNVAV